MSSQVISLFVGRDYPMKIELTEKQKSIMIGSDDSCKKGYIEKETYLAPFHCLIYLQKDENQQSWKTYIQEKALNPQKYVTCVNKGRLGMRETQLLFDNDEIKIGKG